MSMMVLRQAIKIDEFLKDYNSSLDPCSSSQNSTTILVYFGVVHQLSHVEVRKKLTQQHRGPLDDW